MRLKMLFVLACFAIGSLAHSQDWNGANVNATKDVNVKGAVSTQKIKPVKSNDPDYEIVVIPDIQNEVRYAWNYGRSKFQWLKDSAAFYNVKAMLQVGDVTDWNTQAEWDTVTQWVNKIPAGLPYLFVPGNHDYGNGFNPSTRDATRYNATIGVSHFAGKSFYKGHFGSTNENYFISFEVGTKKYLAMGLEFLPRDTVVSWAGHILDSVYAADPTREAMIVTHAYITVPGELATDTSVYSGISYGMTADNSGQELWDKLIKKKANIKWVFSGHYLIPNAWAQTGLTDYIVATGENGNIINQIFINYQDDLNWGDGYIMRLKFRPSQNKVDVRFYSTYFKADDSRVAGYSLDMNNTSVSNTTTTTGTLSVNKDFRVAGEVKIETLKKKTVPFVAEDHLLKSDGSLFFDEPGRTLNTRRLVLNHPRPYGGDMKNTFFEVFDSAGYSLLQLRANKYDPIPYGEAYLANLYIGDSAGYNMPSGWNNTGIGSKVLYRAKWGVNAVSETVAMGKRAAYGMGKRASSYNNVIIGVEALSGDSTYCRFCTFVGQAAGATFEGGEDNTMIGQASGVSMKINSFGNSAIGSNTLQVAYGYQAMAIGKGSFGNSDSVVNSIAIGRSAGRDGKYTRSILIGTFAGYSQNLTDRLIIDNDGTDGVAPLIDGDFAAKTLQVNGTTNADTVKQGGVIIKPYKVYVATLTQSGTSAPVATVLENTIGSIVWGRSGNGLYTATLSGAFTSGKTWLMVNAGQTTNGIDPSQTVKFARSDANTLQLVTAVGSGEDDELTQTSIEIRVYN